MAMVSSALEEYLAAQGDGEVNEVLKEVYSPTEDVLPVV